ncbi:MAG: nucleotidyltransferase domain-containing protein [Euryarchaeota archaeon]|nr:nucleotidyltransferase domain-containing protein [Euryarchaeota archaeon]
MAFPGKEFTGRELALASGCSVPMAIKELNRLLRHGALFTRVAGKAHLWRWESDHYLTAPLSALFTAERRAREELARLLQDELQSSPGLVRLVLFGSVARGEESPESDIDLLAIVADEAAKSALAFRLDAAQTKVASRFGNRLAGVVYSVEEARRKNRLPLMKNIEAEGKVLLDRTP